MMRHSTIAAATLALCGVAMNCHAQQPDSDHVIVDVDTCVDLGTREQRLECYEARVNEILQARETEESTAEADITIPSSEPVEPESSRASRRTDRREAREAEKLEREAAARAAAAAAALEAAAQAAEVAAEAAAAAEDPSYTAGEIVATISALRELEPNAYLITLDNGQVWRQDHEKPYLLRVGTEVRLRPSNWGPSYRLTDPNVGNFIAVRRIK